MAYDHKTRAISINSSDEFKLDSGVASVYNLKTWSQFKEATGSMVIDWKLIEEWLGCFGRELNKNDEAKIRKAWKAYYAMGVAPSIVLQPTFTFWADEYKKSGYSYEQDKPPNGIMMVFDRMLASDDEIRIKREFDRTKSAIDRVSAMQFAISGIHAKTHVSWWRSRSKRFKIWGFASAAWIIVVILYILVFDPFEVGGLRYWSEDEYLKALFVMAIPSFLIGIKVAYEKIIE